MAGGLGWKQADVSGLVKTWGGWRGWSLMEGLGGSKMAAFASVHTGSCSCYKAGRSLGKYFLNLFIFYSES